MKIDINIKLPPVIKGLYYIYKDYEIYPYLPRKESPCPATQKTLVDIFISAKKVYQLFWFEALKILAPDYMTIDELKEIFAEMTHSRTAWTNHHGSEIYADYINGRNLDEIPFEQETLVDRGNVINVNGDRIFSGGEYWLPFETLTVDNLPPISELIDETTKKIIKPYLIHAMTTITTIKLSDGTYKANSFDYFGGETVPLPILSRTGISYIPEKMVIKIDETKPFPSPYNPPRD